MFGKKKDKAPSQHEHRTVIRTIQLGKLYRKVDIREYPMAQSQEQSKPLKTPSKIDRYIGSLLPMDRQKQDRKADLRRLTNQKRQHRPHELQPKR